MPKLKPPDDPLPVTLLLLDAPGVDAWTDPPKLKPPDTPDAGAVPLDDDAATEPKLNPLPPVPGAGAEDDDNDDEEVDPPPPKLKPPPPPPPAPPTPAPNANSDDDDEPSSLRRNAAGRLLGLTVTGASTAAADPSRAVSHDTHLTEASAFCTKQASHFQP